MDIKIPYSLLPKKLIKKNINILIKFSGIISKALPTINQNLSQIEADLDAREYISASILASSVFFLFFFILLNIILYIAGVEKSLIFALIVSLIFTFFVFLQQLAYPRLLIQKKVAGIEKNLLPALQSVLIQLNSGVTLFNVFVTVAREDFGEISKEFEKVVGEINAGVPEIEAIERLGTKNPSLFFRRAIWQLVNGMKAGGNVSQVIEEILVALSGEQLIQIQMYGSRLSPIAMFYMLVAIIIPALAITFLMIISSFISLSGFATKAMLIGLMAFVAFIQVIFLGIIKSRRPNLMGE